MEIIKGLVAILVALALLRELKINEKRLSALLNKIIWVNVIVLVALGVHFLSFMINLESWTDVLPKWAQILNLVSGILLLGYIRDKKHETN